jgi:hypothetical protein
MAWGWWRARQGWDNFRKEFKQLRRSFRFNEYAEIRSASPPKDFFSRVHIIFCPCPLSVIPCAMHGQQFF